MPPLLMFGRKWNVATDDFVYLSFVEVVLRLFIILFHFFYISLNENHFICNINRIYIIFNFILGGAIISNLVVTIVLMIFSAQGKIMEECKRTKVPHCLYIKLILVFTEITMSAIMLILNYKYSIINTNCGKNIFIRSQIIFYSLGSLSFIYMVFIYIIYDKLGSTNMNSGFLNNILAKKRENLWLIRLKCLLCINKLNYQEKAALETAATVLSTLYEETNLVYSDYVAGIQLLCIEDEKISDLKGLSLDVNGYTTKNSISDSSVYFSKYMDDKESKCTFVNFKETKLNDFTKSQHNLSANNVQIENKNDFQSDWRDLRFIYYFATMAKAAYGWPLHLLFQDINKSGFRFCLGQCCKHMTSCLCSNCACCKHEEIDPKSQLLIYAKESFCSCHKRAILNETLLKEENLICVSFYNKTFHSPFFVAISHDIQVIILSIRGTFSLKDVLTDFDANPKEVCQNEFSGCFAHSGMLNAAFNIKRKLQESNVIHDILKDNKNYRLIVTGHSLGAGIAAILSCLYYSEFPNLKCYAFSPPLGTVNIKMADFCKDFVLTIVNGFEWIPRISLQTITVVRNRLINCLETYPHSKYQIRFGKFMKCECLYCSKTAYKWNLLNSFQRDEKFWNNIEMVFKLPGQIVHITKILSLSNSKKSNFTKDKNKFYTPIITSSEQFNAIIFHPKMFRDHFPNKVVNRLFRIVNENKHYPLYHHILKHYWPENKSEDIMKLPFIKSFINPKQQVFSNNFLSNQNDSFWSSLSFNFNCKRKSYIKEIKRSSEFPEHSYNNDIYITISRITVV